MTMKFFSMIASVLKKGQQARPARPIGRRSAILPKFMPRLEALERRDVPSAISFFQTDDAAFIPRMAVLNDPNPVTLGLQFQVQAERLGPVNGTITAIQFYRGAASNAPFTVDLWDAAGNLLGSGTEAGNQSPGWQTVNLTQRCLSRTGELRSLVLCSRRRLRRRSVLLWPIRRQSPRRTRGFH